MEIHFHEDESGRRFLVCIRLASRQFSIIGEVNDGINEAFASLYWPLLISI